MPTLPYVTAPGNITKALTGIQKAATPQKITQDFVKTVLQIPGGSGAQMTAFLKKIGFGNSDGTPSSLYTKFRNPSSSRQAMASAIRHAYAPLFNRNEYMYQLDDKGLLGLIVEETGQAHDSGTVGLIHSAIKNLKAFADFDGQLLPIEAPSRPQMEPEPLARVIDTGSGIALNMGYTINLNLPATTDVAVFNAIFKSLKENLLRADDA